MKSTGISAAADAGQAGASTVPPSLLNRLGWMELASHWETLGPALRRRIASGTGRMLHALWTSREDLARVPPETWLWVPPPVGRLVPPDEGRARLPLALTASHAEEILADWSEASRAFVAPRDRIAFVRAFFDLEVADRHALRHALRNVSELGQRQARRRARRLFRNRLAQHRTGLNAAAVWCDSSVTPDALLAEVRRAEASPETVTIKQGASHTLFRARVFGRDALIKRYALTGAANRAKYWFRPSRARRAWAAAATLGDLDLPTPEPFGYVEAGIGRAAAQSYLVTEFRPRAVSVRAWVKTRYRSLDPDNRRAFRRELAAFLLSLHHRGVYHADTKALNMLIEEDDAGARRLCWIDVDGVQPGRAATRRDVLRNLVQLNGSVRSWVPEDERLDFLRRLAPEFPWLRHPNVAVRLQRWTERRLRKEIRTRCGP